MEVIIMRHGERDDQPCHDRGFIGQGLELAPLTDNGVKQAGEAAQNPLIDEFQIYYFKTKPGKQKSMVRNLY